jgi:putative nucleotidyltransferase with HDIG domain
MFGLEDKSRFSRRRSGRECRTDHWQKLREMRARGLFMSLMIAAGFWAALTALMLLRQDVVPYRPGEYVPHDLVARVDFRFYDKVRHEEEIEARRENAWRVYRQTPGDIWISLQNYLLKLPETVHGRQPEELEAPLGDILDSGAITELEQARTGADRKQYENDVKSFINDAQNHLVSDNKPLVIIKQDDLDQELKQVRSADVQRKIVLLPPQTDPESPAANSGEGIREIDVSSGVLGTNLSAATRAILENSSRGFALGLGSKIAEISIAEMAANPTYTLDEQATIDRRNKAEEEVDPKDAYVSYARTSQIVPGGTTLTDQDWLKLNAENTAYHSALASNSYKTWQYRLGLALMAGIITVILCGYVARYQPRCVRNHARGMALALLLLSMLLLTQLAAIGSTSLYIFGIAPTILVAIILTVAYDQRFATGMATIHAIIVTAAVNQGLEFFLILWVGVLTTCYLLNEIRTRVKLIEVGGAAALAMIIATAAVSAVQMEPVEFIGHNCLYVGAAGLAAGFIVLGILPFIEKAFRITTSMTLLELADASQPLLRRLALEAPGTYNHSLQVATLAEAAAESIHINSLLCRVSSYYHDIGKISKPDYFVENQMGGENRHINLSPTLSLRIIISHVKEGVEMAKEYNLPTNILPVIGQHHGTTLVEYFYYQAMTQGQQAPDAGPLPSDTEFRYPGPKPKSKESAVVMLCDCVESACRTLSEPTASRIESLVHELARKRLEDGQFDECDLTLRDLQMIERSLIKTLLGIYHGRITYPSTSAISTGKTTTGASATKTA